MVCLTKPLHCGSELRPKSLSENNHTKFSLILLSIDVEASREERVFSKRHALSSPRRYSAPDRSSSGCNSLAFIMPDQEIRQDNWEGPSGLKTHEFMIHLI